jgi:hypothetical protein
MKAYKGFNKDMTCTPNGGKPFQYKEGETYKEPEADLCAKGFHACLDPLDCLNYYNICDSVYREVELDDVSDQREENDTKVCGRKIKIGARLNLKDMIKTSIDFVMESCKKEESKSSGDFAKLASSGNFAKLASSGNFAQLASSGNFAQLASSGDSAQLASSGDSAKLASSGNFAKLASSGDSAKLASSGKDSVVMSAGINGKVKAAVGNWIAIAEWKIKDSHFVPVGIVAAKVDGKKIKADTWYKAENGQLVEAEEE